METTHQQIVAEQNARVGKLETRLLLVESELIQTHENAHRLQVQLQREAASRRKAEAES